MRAGQLRKRICEICEMPFMASGARSLYCTPECKAVAHNLRRREKYRAGTLAPQQPNYSNRRKTSEKAMRLYWEARNLANSIKLGAGCADCGYNKHPDALQFDHVRGVKYKMISSLRTPRSVLMELGKCEIVCANCHAVRTAERRVAAKLANSP